MNQKRSSTVSQCYLLVYSVYVWICCLFVRTIQTVFLGHSSSSLRLYNEVKDLHDVNESILALHHAETSHLHKGLVTFYQGVWRQTSAPVGATL